MLLREVGGAVTRAHGWQASSPCRLAGAVNEGRFGFRRHGRSAVTWDEGLGTCFPRVRALAPVTDGKDHGRPAVVEVLPLMMQSARRSPPGWCGGRRAPEAARPRVLGTLA